jgi:hypothetical protein
VRCHCWLTSRNYVRLKVVSTYCIPVEALKLLYNFLGAFSWHVTEDSKHEIFLATAIKILLARSSDFWSWILKQLRLRSFAFLCAGRIIYDNNFIFIFVCIADEFNKFSLVLAPLCRLHTAKFHWPLSSTATKEVQGPDTSWRRFQGPPWSCW